MPNTREKLIELLACAEDSLLEQAVAWDDEQKEEHIADGDGYGFYADYLIAHGVTVQKWIPVTERLPDSSVKYIVVADSKYHTDMRVVSAKSLMVEEFWGMPMGYFAHGQQVTHWMPLPPAPKGE